MATLLFKYRCCYDRVASLRSRRYKYIFTPFCQNTIFQVIKNLIITNNAIVTAVKWNRPNNDQQARFHTLTVNTIIKADDEADKYESTRITLTNKLPSVHDNGVSAFIV
jgi:hypothetical protein